MLYLFFDKDEYWYKLEQVFFIDDYWIILCFVVEVLMFGKGVVLVMLVEICGGVVCLFGVQMVVCEDGCYCGFVFGGCVEVVVVFEVLEMMGLGCDCEICYGEGLLWFDIVLFCGGGIMLMFYKLCLVQFLFVVLNCLEQRKLVGLCYDL